MHAKSIARRILPNEGQWFVGWSQATAAAESHPPPPRNKTAGSGFRWERCAVHWWGINLSNGNSVSRR